MTNDLRGQSFRTISQNHTSSPSWTCSSAFGIIHPYGCRTCCSYQTHLIDAAESDLDYARAVHDREMEPQNRYSYRKTWRQYQNNLLKIYRSRRDSTRETQLLFRLLHEKMEAMMKAKEEVMRLIDELLTVGEVTDEGLQPWTPPEDFDWVASGEVLDESNYGSDLGEPDFDPPISLRTSEFYDAPDNDFCAPVSAHTEPGDGKDVEDGIDNAQGWTSHPTGVFNQPHSSSEDLVETDEVTHLSLHSLQLALEDERGLGSAKISRSHPLQSNPPGPLPSHSARTPNAPLHQLLVEYYTPEGIRKKMARAWHPGNERTVAEVEGLVSAAHMTPSCHRTEVHRILLNEWRNPLMYPLTKRTFILVRSSDVCVDASLTGIGFVFKNQWQAWRLKEGWKERTREIQWAEAVAVELGVRLMIEAGYRQSTLRVRSDNSGALEAISEREIHRSQVGETVERIYRLCEEHDITLEIKWIPGWANPADRPSRLCPEEGTPRFPHAITIPTHLREYVFPYTP